MRKQYHFRNSRRELLAWDVDRLLDLTAKLEAFDLPLDKIRELDETFWFSTVGDVPACRRIAEHGRLIQETSLEHPITRPTAAAAHL
jgi:hypothetical protein